MPSLEGPTERTASFGIPIKPNRVVCLQWVIRALQRAVMDYHSNGNKAYSVTVVDGVAQGLATEWHENGQKKTEATLQDGEAVGVLRGWYDNGQPQYDVPLQNGEAEGITTEFYPGGQRRNETMYVAANVMACRRATQRRASSNGMPNGGVTGCTASTLNFIPTAKSAVPRNMKAASMRGRQPAGSSGKILDSPVD